MGNNYCSNKANDIIKRLTLRSVFLASTLGLLSTSSYSQCPNIDFTLQDFTNWNGFTGTYPGYFNLTTPGIVPGRHDIITNPGNDPIGPTIVLPAPGYTVNAKLGNQNTGMQAESLEYPFVVGPNSQLVLYDFAVVYHNPVGHSLVQMPRMEVDVVDNIGNVVGCSSIFYAAGNPPPGITFLNGNMVSGESTQYTNWAKVGVDMSGVPNGTQCTLRVRTADCSLSGHFGYGYFRAECRPLQIEVDYCQGDTIALLNAPLGFVSYQWQFNGIPINGATSATYTAPNPQSGTYSVVVRSVTGCDVTLSTIINPVEPYAQFTAAPACDGRVIFTDQSTALNSTITGWSWTFGDGGTSNIQNPIHQYNTPGTYNVQLLAYAAGCSKPDTFVLPVTPPPIITPGFIQPPTCSLTQPFQDTSTFSNGQGVAWFWNFGDGGTSTQQNPTHTYPSSGTYNVTLIVTNNFNCSDTIVVPVNIGAIPVAAWSAPDRCLNQTVQFTDASTPFQNSTITNWNWNFGDNGSSVQQNPSHNYNTPGTYNVSLVVTGSEGCTDTLTQAVTIHPLPEPDFIFSKACLGMPTTFTNQTTILNPGQVTNYVWYFGTPGIPINTQTSPTVLYNNPGTYLVQLIAGSDKGCVDTIVIPITISPQPQVSFNGNPLQGCAPVTVSFNNTSFSSTGVDSVSWNFGDGNFDTTYSASHVYNQSGTFDVSLTVVAPGGCDSTLMIPAYVTVFPQPTADFTVQNDCHGDTLNITQQSSVTQPGMIDTYDWTVIGITNPGTGTYNQSNPEISGLNPGDYQLELIVGTNQGCADTMVANFTIYENPVPDFSVITECYNKNILTDASTGGLSPLEASWDLDGDGFPDEYGTPLEYVFLDSSDKNVTLFITDANGCTSDTTKLIDVKGAPTLNDMPNILVQASTMGNDKYDFQVFSPGFNECIDYTLAVFNRWGLKVFETSNIKGNPDLTCTGCFRGLTGGGDALTPGVYFFVMKGENGFNREGTITIVQAQ